MLCDTVGSRLFVFAKAYTCVVFQHAYIGLPRERYVAGSKETDLQFWRFPQMVCRLLFPVRRNNFLRQRNVQGGPKKLATSMAMDLATLATFLSRRITRIHIVYFPVL